MRIVLVHSRDEESWLNRVRFVTSGQPCEGIDLQISPQSKEEVDKDFIWARLLSSKQSKFLMGASTCPDNAGSGAKGLNSRLIYVHV